MERIYRAKKLLFYNGYSPDEVDFSWFEKTLSENNLRFWTIMNLSYDYITRGEAVYNVSRYNKVDDKSFSFVPKKGYYLNNERVRYKNLPLYGYTKPMDEILLEALKDIPLHEKYFSYGDHEVEFHGILPSNISITLWANEESREEIIIYTIGRNCDYSTLSELVEKLRRLV